MKRNSILFPSFFMVFLVAFSSCYYDKEELLYPNSQSVNCDTATVISYASKVVPILSTQCYGCHAGSGSGGIVMGTYTTDKAIATNGKLYGSIAYLSGFSAMPKGAAKMQTCQINLIKKWIDAGSPNN